MEIIIKLQRPKPSVVFDTYWKFAAERQNIFFNKINNSTYLTHDKVLLKHKFTNAYRASDRVSQYLIKNVIYSDRKYTEYDVIFRILLFKIFNKISTWELLESELDDIRIETYNFDRLRKILSDAKEAQESIYSGAYIMASGKSYFGYNLKHENHLRLLEKYFVKEGFADKLIHSNSLSDIYKSLLQLPTLGSFLAFQYAIDINYSEVVDFSEMDFVVPGPGAKDGIRKCFTDLGDFTETDIIKWVTDGQEKNFSRLNLEFKNLWGRKLQLIDCQNLFCEVDKYARVVHPDISGVSDRKRIKQTYRANKDKIDLFYPPKWDLNKHIF